MSVTFVSVTTPLDQELLARASGEIWREYWPAHIGVDQTEYMIENFQSLAAIRRDMAAETEPYEYWFIYDSEANADDTPDWRISPEYGVLVGYTGGHNEAATNRFFISKIYLFAEMRGRGYCSRTIEHYVALCRNRGFRAMYLTVNKYNDLAVRAYIGKQFETIDSVETDIGCGFIMDDFIMEKQA